MGFDFSQIGRRREPLGCRYAWEGLHGLCALGFAGHAVVRNGCGGDPARVRAFEACFSKVVFPGDTLATEGWRVDDRVLLRVTTRERGVTVLTHAFAEVT